MHLTHTKEIEMKVHHETFNGGTVEVTFQGKTFTANANQTDDGQIFVKGFVGKYRTGKTIWNATVRSQIVNGEQELLVYFGRDDRMSFNKNQIFYKPE
jgi:hypothetical protein